MRGDVRRGHFAKKREHLESFFVKQFVHAAHFSGGRAGNLREAAVKQSLSRLLRVAFACSNAFFL